VVEYVGWNSLPSLAIHYDQLVLNVVYCCLHESSQPIIPFVTVQHQQIAETTSVS
jgi:hypothetical protein